MSAVSEAWAAYQVAKKENQGVVKQPKSKELKIFTSSQVGKNVPGRHDSSILKGVVYQSRGSDETTDSESSGSSRSPSPPVISHTVKDQDKEWNWLYYNKDT